MKYDIVYSITAHESIECVFNLYENIIKFNAGLNCLVMFHVNELLFSQTHLLPKKDNLLFNPNHTEKGCFTQSLFLAHLENYELVRDVVFDFFCLLASNCMFIRQINYPLIQSTTPALSPTYHELAKDTSINFDDIKKEWFWPIYFRCQDVIDLFSRHKMGVMARGHEGAYFRKEVMSWICSFCRDNIIGRITLIDGAGWEEIIFPTLEKYLTGRLGTRYCKHFPFDREITEAELIELAASDNDCNIVKRVERSMDSRVRKFICTSL